MNEKSKEKFLKDFIKVDISEKLNMWFYALEQEEIWGEILAEMSDIAQEKNIIHSKILEE